MILVGHSAGGLSITQACHKFSKKIRLAVYLAATMLKLGFQTEEDMKDVTPFHITSITFIDLMPHSFKLDYLKNNYYIHF